MKKRLIIDEVIDGTCHDCIHCQYDSDYGISYDSGYDCHQDPGEFCKRIADDSEIESYSKHVKEKEKTQSTLFPEEVTQKDPMSIPEWCPLETIV